MAILDQGQLVVRIVYDGPPQAGKTSSLIALGKSLGREVVCAGESEGRTLYFDWLDYVGGRFDGRSIRCQVVTVPGQTSLWPRRRALLESADAIVFVADTVEECLDADLEALDQLNALLNPIEPRPAVILQANKRDLPGALSLDRVRERLSSGNLVAVTESVASQGRGIRETFILAVRLALDRAREMTRLGVLAEGSPAVDNAADLLGALQAMEGEMPLRLAGAQPRQEVPAAGPPQGTTQEPVARPTGPQVHEPRAADPHSHGDRHEAVPRPPDPSIPGGMIWPPIGGRIILHEAEPDTARMGRLTGGGWADVGNPRWLIHSPPGARYDQLETGRQRLIAWARWHSRLGGLLSSKRCIVLAEDSLRRWRLWQVVGRSATLRGLLLDAFANGEATELAHRLVTAAEALMTLRDRPELDPLHPNLDSVGPEDGRWVFTGLMPTTPAEPESGEERAETDSERPVRDLPRALADGLRTWAGDRTELAAELSRRRSQTTAPGIVDSLVEIART
ncbi:MAG: ADP-ribosylation factor-like protein [Acidobacteriota bacterium]